MSDFEDRLRRSLEHRADQAEVSPDGLRRIAQRADRRRWTGVVAFALATVIVLGAVVTLSSFLDRDRGRVEFAEDPPTTEPAVTVPSATESATARPAAPSEEPLEAGTSTPTRWEWSRVDHDAAIFAPGPLVAIDDVAFLPSGRAVAVGDHTLTTNPGAGVAAAWISDQPGQWQLVDRDPVFGDETTNAGMEAITTFGDAVVAVGVYAGRATAWHSTDGRVWERSDSFGPDSLVYDVAATDASLVAVGETIRGDVREGAIWTSPDGLTWDRVGDLPTLTTVDHVNTGSGAVVALARDKTAAVSVDGGPPWELVETWTNQETVDVFATTERGYLRVAIQDTGADDGQWRLVVETSDTLTDWSTHGVGDSIRARAGAAVQVGDSVVTVGTDVSAGADGSDPQYPVIFAGSTDGRDWTRVFTDTERGGINGVAARGRVVAVGAVGETTATNGAIWETPVR